MIFCCESGVWNQQCVWFELSLIQTSYHTFIPPTNAHDRLADEVLYPHWKCTGVGIWRFMMRIYACIALKVLKHKNPPMLEVVKFFANLIIMFMMSKNIYGPFPLILFIQLSSVPLGEQISLITLLFCRPCFSFWYRPQNYTVGISIDQSYYWFIVCYD